MKIAHRRIALLAGAALPAIAAAPSRPAPKFGRGFLPVVDEINALEFPECLWLPPAMAELAH